MSVDKEDKQAQSRRALFISQLDCLPLGEWSLIGSTVAPCGVCAFATGVLVIVHGKNVFVMIPTGQVCVGGPWCCFEGAAAIRRVEMEDNTGLVFLCPCR